MVYIYCLEDINDLKYVGSTKQTLNTRFNEHKRHKKNGRNISSLKLNLEYCIIYVLEECNECDRKEREKYWINNTDCVNKYKLNLDEKEYNKKYHKEKKKKNKDKINSNRRKWGSNNKDKVKQYNKKYRTKQNLL